MSPAGHRSVVCDSGALMLAAREHAVVISADPGDIEHLLDCLEVRRPVIPV